MKMRTLIGVLVAGAMLTLSGMPAARSAKEPAYTSTFPIAQAVLRPYGGSAYFGLYPGRWLRLEGEDDGEPTIVEMTVLDEVRVITFVSSGRFLRAPARVVEEREWINGELAEISRNFYAACEVTGNVYYFGEEVELYEDGAVISNEGSWIAGVDGAQPGLFMPGFFLLGSRYVHEIAPGVAMDRAENLAMNMRIATPAGMFEDCVMTLDTTPMDPTERTIKVYAAGIGPIIDGNLKLVAFSN